MQTVVTGIGLVQATNVTQKERNASKRTNGHSCFHWIVAGLERLFRRFVVHAGIGFLLKGCSLLIDASATSEELCAGSKQQNSLAYILLD
jgi:hypothetical protein